METNLLRALLNIQEQTLSDLSKVGVIPKANLSAVIRANNAGDALDFYVKDAFCGTFNETDPPKKIGAYAEAFSYLGNQNNPPDIMLKGSDAIEVKKTGVNSSIIALNSSYPKSKLYSDNPMITKTCKNCENWNVKDMIYAVGNVSPGMKLNTLSFVYGDCYAASRELYERVWNAVVKGIANMDLEFSTTKELGRINKVDPLGITDLRIRGMWQIKQPARVFSHLFKTEHTFKTSVFALMRQSKWNSLSASDRKSIESAKPIKTSDVQIRDPDNPANMLKAKLISLGW